jgi:hypothetical protein
MTVKRSRKHIGTYWSETHWYNYCPRKSGWYWVYIPDDEHPELTIMQVEGRDQNGDGWVWLADTSRFYLTPGARDETGDEKQSETWRKWWWWGPIQEPVILDDKENSHD